MSLLVKPDAMRLSTSSSRTVSSDRRLGPGGRDEVAPPRVRRQGVVRGRMVTEGRSNVLAVEMIEDGVETVVEIMGKVADELSDVEALDHVLQHDRPEGLRDACVR